MTSSNPDRLLTIVEAASRRKCSPQTIRRAVKSGELPAIQDNLKAGHPFLVREEDVDNFRQPKPVVVSPV